MRYIVQSVTKLLSVIFHPLLIIIYVFGIFYWVNPYLFPYSQNREFGAIFLIILFTAVVIPGISILLMRGIGLIGSLQMHDKKERIGPLIVTAVSYLWLYLNIRTHNAIPMPFSQFVLGCLIAIFIAFFINNFHKISLHAIGMGGMIMITAYLIETFGHGYVYMSNIVINNIFILAMIIILCGAVLSSRLYLKAHSIQDVVGGLLVGIFSQIIAIRFF